MRRVLAIALLLAVAGCNLLEPGERFLVFFTEFSAQLDEPAKSTIAGAATYAKNHPLQPVHVVGFADPTGSPQANIELSKLRAQVVTDALVAGGVPASSITQQAEGATKFELSATESRRVVVTIGSP